MSLPKSSGVVVVLRSEVLATRVLRQWMRIRQGSRLGWLGRLLVRVSPCRSFPFHTTSHFIFAPAFPLITVRATNINTLFMREGGSPTELLVTASELTDSIPHTSLQPATTQNCLVLRSILRYPIGSLLRLHAERRGLCFALHVPFAFFCLIAEHAYIRTCSKFVKQSSLLLLQ